MVDAGDSSASKEVRHKPEHWTCLWDPYGSLIAIPVFWIQRWRSPDTLTGYTNCSELRDQVRDSASVGKVGSD